MIIKYISLVIVPFVAALDVSKTDNATIELYNLKDDARKNNVADKNPAIVKQMEEIIKEAYVPNKNWTLLAGEANRSALK